MLEIQDSDAVAIVNHQYQVLYSNESFNILNNFDIDPGKMKVCENLKPLGLLNWDSKKYNAQTSCIYHEDLDIFVYILNRSSHENFFLILIKNPGGRRKLISETQDNRYMGKEEFEPEELLPEFKGVVGESIRFRRALMLAQRAARSDVPVLILGESGTGKEMVAQAIHRASSRRNKQLVDVNCAAIPETLIESELFGYERGAFTGARTEGRKGYFDEAHEGTIMLDEIGDAALQTQAKLLRVLEDGCFKRVGGNRNVKVDVRIISSTNQELTKFVEEKKFREDLYYRLNTFTITLPPLRERSLDIPLLVDHFLAAYRVKEKKPFMFQPSAMDILLKYHWPGNVRELKSVVYYAVNLSSESSLSPHTLPGFLFSSGEHKQREISPAENSAFSLQTHNLLQMVELLEKDMIREALTESATKTEAIRKLGISRKTFYMKIKQYGLDKRYREKSFK